MRDLIAKIEKLDGPDREVDREIEHKMVFPNEAPHNFAISIRDEWDVPHYTASLDAAVALVERVLPDTDDRRHRATIWVGAKPAARIFYDQRDEEAEGGWGIGALNQWEVRGVNPAIALVLATLKAKEAQDG